MPDRQFNTFGVKWNLNPGPFNLKEHTAIVIMANAAFGGGVGYFTDTLTAQKIWYKNDLGIGWDICFALSTQMAGFAIAGLMRKWLVEAGELRILLIFICDYDADYLDFRLHDLAIQPCQHAVYVCAT